jgi:hypothetical protein
MLLQIICGFEKTGILLVQCSTLSLPPPPRIMLRFIVSCFFGHLKVMWSHRAAGSRVKSASQAVVQREGCKTICLHGGLGKVGRFARSFRELPRVWYSYGRAKHRKASSSWSGKTRAFLCLYQIQPRLLISLILRF